MPPNPSDCQPAPALPQVPRNPPNAFTERFDRTYPTEVLKVHLFGNLEQVQVITDQCLVHCNEYRPHEALGGVPPVLFMPPTSLGPESLQTDVYLTGVVTHVLLVTTPCWSTA